MDYDEIYTEFITKCGYQYTDLPQSDVERYHLIKSGVSIYNQKTQKYKDRITTNIQTDDSTESINQILSDDELLALVYCMCSVIASTKLAEFVSTWCTVAEETGIKDYKAQVTARQDNVQYYYDLITNIIEDRVDTFVL